MLEEDAVVGTLLLLEGAEELVEVVEGRLDRLLLRRGEGELAVLQEAAQVHLEEGARILRDGPRSALHPLHLVDVQLLRKSDVPSTIQVTVTFDDLLRICKLMKVERNQICKTVGPISTSPKNGFSVELVFFALRYFNLRQSRSR